MITRATNSGGQIRANCNAIVLKMISITPLAFKPNPIAKDAFIGIPGYHDEPLKGNRTGQRSIRLSKAYRAIYIIDNDDNIEIVKVLEVNKHDY